MKAISCMRCQLALESVGFPNMNHRTGKPFNPVLGPGSVHWAGPPKGVSVSRLVSECTQFILFKFISWVKSLFLCGLG